NELTSNILLHLFSQYSNQFNTNNLNNVKIILSKLKCISTNQGMKLPQQSYISSANLSKDLPQITFDISSEYSLSIEFLKSIGCRTIDFSITTITNHLNSTDNNQTLQDLIQNLLKQRENMSDTDVNALGNTPCFAGINGETKRNYKANELHFPSVAKEVQWKDLSVIDWIDINPFSQEYIFLKELGVKEAPDFQDLFLHITQEHNQSSKIKSEYQLPPSLIYFAENFRKYYLKIWENNKIIQIPFLPSSSPPHINQSTEVILTIPQLVFKETSPLFPSLLPDVIRCFSHCFDISLLGIKSRPDLQIAFDILIDKQYEILTIESASLYFSYLNKLDGLNKTFIENISKKSFIPYSSSSSYSKPSQIFIRS
ncbi:unnamed protein product, partial [Adineta steineri]